GASVAACSTVASTAKKISASVRSRIPGGYSISLGPPRSSAAPTARKTVIFRYQLPTSTRAGKYSSGCGHAIPTITAISTSRSDDRSSTPPNALGAAHSRAIVPSRASSAALIASAARPHRRAPAPNAIPAATPIAAPAIVALSASRPARKSARAPSDWIRRIAGVAPMTLSSIAFHGQSWALLWKNDGAPGRSFSRVWNLHRGIATIESVTTKPPKLGRRGQAVFASILLAILSNSRAAAAPPLLGLIGGDFTILRPGTTEVLGRAHYAFERAGTDGVLRGENRYLDGEYDIETDHLELSASSGAPTLAAYEHWFYARGGAPLLSVGLD